MPVVMVLPLRLLEQDEGILAADLEQAATERSDSGAGILRPGAQHDADWALPSSLCLRLEFLLLFGLEACMDEREGKTWLLVVSYLARCLAGPLDLLS